MSESITTLKKLIKKLQQDFAFIGENYESFDDQDAINYQHFIANTLKNISAELHKLACKHDNYCRLVLIDYLAYIYDSFEEYDWMFPDREPLPASTIKKIFTRIFAGEHSTRHTPFVNTLDITFEGFSKFCHAIYLDENNEYDADTAEVLLRAIKDNNIPKMKAILIKDRTLLTRVYSLNNSIDEFGFTPLMYAAKYCDMKIIRDGLFSVIKGKKEILIYISNKIKDSNSQFQSYNLIMIAARWGQSGTFAYLLDNQTPRAVNVMLESILSALITPYFNADANKSFKKIRTMLTNQPTTEKFERILKGFIFSDNENLVAKLRCLVVKIAELNITNVVADEKAEATPMQIHTSNRMRLFSASSASNDASIHADPLPKRRSVRP